MPIYLIYFGLLFNTALAHSFRPLTSLSYLFRTSMRYCLSPLLISLPLSIRNIFLLRAQILNWLLSRVPLPLATIPDALFRHQITIDIGKVTLYV